jgi:hypothetical protein
MDASSTDRVSDQLAALRAELVEQAYALERQGRLDAADVAISLSHRLAELCPASEAESAR